MLREPEGTRTPNRRLKGTPLCQLSYRFSFVLATSVSSCPLGVVVENRTPCPKTVDLQSTPPPRDGPDYNDSSPGHRFSDASRAHVSHSTYRSH